VCQSPNEQLETKANSNMDRVIQSMENFLTTVPRFLASEAGQSLVASTDGQQQEMQVSRIAKFRTN